MKDIIISFKVNEEMRDTLKALARDRDTTMSQIIREFIREGLKKE